MVTHNKRVHNRALLLCVTILIQTHGLPKVVPQASSDHARPLGNKRVIEQVAFRAGSNH